MKRDLLRREWGGLLRLEQHLQNHLEETRPEHDDVPHDVCRLLDCIHAEAFEPSLNVEMLKRRCGLRNNNVTSRFRRSVGIGLREYLEEIRLTAACRLLEAEDTEIYLIAAAVGYEYPETFHRAFQKRLDMTPLGYRKSRRKASTDCICEQSDARACDARA